MLIVNVLILIASIKILNQTHNPLHPALIYTICRFIFGLMFTGELISTLIGTIISFILTFFYFWLLNKTEGSIFWWIILILGIAIGLI